HQPRLRGHSDPHGAPRQKAHRPTVAKQSGRWAWSLFAVHNQLGGNVTRPAPLLNCLEEELIREPDNGPVDPGSLRKWGVTPDLAVAAAGRGRSARGAGRN